MTITRSIETLTELQGNSLIESSHFIQAEILAKLGFLPPFFLPAIDNLQVLAHLWHQALSAYLDNPLPALFKEKLSAYLSRFCIVPYCMICHSCSLYSLGMQAKNVLNLLQSPPPTALELEHHLAILMSYPDRLTELSQLDTEIGDSILNCAIFMALQAEATEPYRLELRRLLGESNYQHLITFIAYVKSCHSWMEANSGIAYQDDRRVQENFDALIAQEPELADFFRYYWQQAKRDRQTWAEQQAELAERKQAEIALRHSEERFHLIAQVTNDAIWEWDLLTDRVWWNEGVQTLFGYHPHGVEPGVSWWYDHIHPQDLNRVVAHIHQVLQSSAQFWSDEYHFRCADGHYAYVSDRAYIIRDTDGQVLRMIGGMTDMTERKRVEDDLATQTKILQKQAQLLDLADNAILVRDMDNRITFWNHGAERLYGWTKEQGLGQCSHTFLQTKSTTPIAAIYQQLLQDNYWHGELTHIRQDHKLVTVNSHWALQRDQAGNPIAILEINSDITEKKALESQVLRAQRMESLGTLAGGIAHDLNNILTPILSSAQLLLMQDTSNDRKRQQLLEIIQDSARRGADLIKQVLSFARGIEGKRTILQTRHLISEIRQIAQETFHKSINLHLNLARDLWLVSGDATQLHQVLMNLCVNARDAMPQGGQLSLSAANLWIDQQYAQMHLDAQVGSYIVITVADTGMGIPPDHLDRIFEPFFTTKEVGQGTGLGLSTALAIVKSHAGFVEVHSQPGQGTEFKVYLPAVKTDEPQAIPDEEVSIGRGELILVVDDEAAIRESNQVSLEAYNYRVLTAIDGIDAIAVYAEHKQEIQLVLVDLMMPTMDGAAAIRALKRINPQVKLIAVSGLVSSSQLSTSIEGDIHAFLPKPYTANELARCIAQVLQGV
ncbi:PAS domain S-box protein [Pantanalinema rosaneae CENA516]|uniref:PAS domain-containing hybrid sensor histidine kinase/response regulator n=1 Tax=Pantanalinema rosaneae TaxID=1620701 RepID=UPI003D6E99FF